MNELKDLHDFFAASVGSAAALIGLLFVAISIAPEKTFGGGADVVRRISAERAFIALGNVFFVSLTALLPLDALQALVAIAALATINTVRVMLPELRNSRIRAKWHELGLFSLVIYLLELYIVWRMLHGDQTEGLVWVMLGLYAYALGTAWRLLGARGRGR